MNLIFYHVAKILFSNFICIFKTLTALEVYHITIIRGVVNKKLTIFEALRISRRVFHISYFFQQDLMEFFYRHQKVVYR